MSYEMMISVSENGAPIIGATACKEYGVSAETMKVYPSQFAYRCTYRRPDGTFGISAPSRVPDGCTLYARFPKADHSHAR